MGGYGLEFDGKDEWNFGNHSAGNVNIFGVDNISSSPTDYRKKKLVLGEVDAFGINGSFCAPEKV